MGEFVGIHPLGAEKLIRQMEAGKDVLGRARPGREAAIAEAGDDWAGRAGVTAMHRTWAFFHESQQDLTWRIATIKRMVPTRQQGMLTGTFPFNSQTVAAQAAKHDADAITQALNSSTTTGTLPGKAGTRWRRLYRHSTEGPTTRPTPRRCWLHLGRKPSRSFPATG